jgi:cobalt-zinc-cadmium efflux system membrane fusion protein
MLIQDKKQSTHYIFLLLILFIIGLPSCSNVEEQKTKVTDEKIDVVEINSISISDLQFENAGMILGEIQEHAFHQTFKSYGIIDVPPENKSSVSAYFGGYVKQIKLLEGQRVVKGKVLFTLENPDYIEIQQDFLETKDQLAYLKSDYERQKNLVQDNVTSQKIYLKAEMEYKITLVKYESLKKKLWLMNINPEILDANSIRSEINITSPLSGYITTVNATRGMFLNPDDIALTIINADHIHLDLSVFEKDLAKIKKGQRIQFKMQNESHKEYDAYVYLVGKYIDPEKRSASIHGHLVNEEETSEFTPGMYIEADIFSSSDTLMAIPEDAIVSIEEHYFVLVKLRKEGDNTLFQQREVFVGISEDGFTEILNPADFNAGDEFLIRGAFNLIGE